MEQDLFLCVSYLFFTDHLINLAPLIIWQLADFEVYRQQVNVQIFTPEARWKIYQANRYLNVEISPRRETVKANQQPEQFSELIGVY